MNNNDPLDLDFRFPISPTTHQNAVVSTTAFAVASSSTCAHHQQHQNPRKKRSKLSRVDDPAAAAAATRISRPKYAKKPDPSAPKITKPCSECGKKFWSWKALFGHMRCHPERQWRGIDPPPNLRRPVSLNRGLSKLELAMGEEDHEAASSLLMLANGTSSIGTNSVGTGNEITMNTQSVSTTSTFQGVVQEVDHHGGNCRFECSSCKKVFGSHQALGGHRASHKNVKGCFAITRSDGEVDQDHHHHHHNGHDVVVHGHGHGDDGDDDHDDGDHGDDDVMVLGGHKCSICWRVFSSGQALGGHKRCHWEKGDHEPSSSSLAQLGPNNNNNPCGSKEGSGGLDLNLPPAPHTNEDDQSSSYSSSALTLDLRLGL